MMVNLTNGLMKRFVLLLALITTSLCAFNVQPLQVLCEAGIEGAFIGAVDRALIVAGGIKEGKFRNEIVVLEKLKNGETRKYSGPGFDLPFPLAHGASLSFKESLICLGGEDGKKCFDNVVMLKWNSERKQIEFSHLPSLPFPLAHASAAHISNKLFLIGGIQDTQITKPNPYLLELDLSSIKPPAWHVRGKLPGPDRLGPAVVAQSNGLREILYIFGGSDPRTHQPLTDAYTFDDQLNQWRNLGFIPFEFQPLSAASSGANHIYLNGKELYAYHTITNTWTQLSGESLGQIVDRPIVSHKETTYFGPTKETSDVYTHSAQFKYNFGTLNTAILVGYVSLLIVVGIYFYKKKQHTPQDYFKANCKIPWWAAGLSILGTEVSALNFLAVPAKSFASDWQYLVMEMTLVLVVPVILFGFVPFYRNLRVTTAYEYLENRFNLPVRLVGSAIFIFFELLRIGIVLYLPAVILSFITGWSIALCIMAMGGFSILYTLMGGIEAVIWTDVIQVIIFISGAVIAICYVFYDCQMNLPDATQIAFANEKLKIFDFALDFRRPTFWVLIISSISYDVMDYGSDQSTVQRYLTVRDQKEAIKSVWLNVVFCFFLGILFYGLGSSLYVFYRKFPEMMDTGMQLTDNIFAHYIVTRMPQGISGLLITGVFAAAMSALDGSINAISTAIANDFYLRLGGQAKDHKVIKIAKWATLFVGLLGTIYAVLLTQYKIISFLDHYDTALAFTLCSVSGLFLLGMFTKKANPRGVLIGLICSILCLYLIKRFTNLHFLLLMPISTASTFIFGYLASLLQPMSSAEKHPFTVFARKS